ncbi:MAG: glycosyltransferase [Alphaproteobacteria bacterium]|nr:glycosyltransferase [Alphaproteobacteria bacterium]
MQRGDWTIVRPGQSVSLPSSGARANRHAVSIAWQDDSITAVRERWHRVKVRCRGLQRPTPCLIVFADPGTGRPRRTLPLLLTSDYARVNGFELIGDERVEAIAADAAARIEVSVSPRGALYAAARTAAKPWISGEPPPRTTADIAALAAALPPPLNLSRTPTVSIVIPTRDRSDLLSRAIETAIAPLAYPKPELIIVDNGSVEAATRALFEQLKTRFGATIIRHDAPFNFAELNNIGARAATGEVLVLLNNDIEAIEPNWLTRLVAQCLAPNVGAVGARLLYPHGAVQHVGMGLGLGGLVGHIGRGDPAESIGPNGARRVPHPVDSVTGACLATRSEVFRSLGGLDETFAIEFNDVDYCLRLGAAGLSTWVEPSCVLIHHEKQTRGRGRPSAEVMADQIAFMRRWGPRFLDPRAGPATTHAPIKRSSAAQESSVAPDATNPS